MPLAGPLDRGFAFPIGSTGLHALPGAFPALATGNGFTAMAGLPFAASPNAVSTTGSTTPSSPVPSGSIPVGTVPEPASTALLALGGLLLTVLGVQFKKRPRLFR